MVQKKINRLIKINDHFDNNYIEYQSKGNKDKILSIKEYLKIIKTYLCNIINDYKEELLLGSLLKSMKCI